jgi:hypothetical protein
MRHAFEIFSELQEHQRESLERVRERYKDNPWWESRDDLYALKYQIDERIQVIFPGEFLEALSKVLERPITQLEFACYDEEIRGEARLAIRRRERGIGQSEEQREQLYCEGRKRLEESVEKLGERAIVLGNVSDRDERGIDVSGYDGWL